MDDQAPMSVEVARESGIVVVRPEGDIDLASSPALRTTLRDIVGEQHQRIVIDLGGVQYMDSSGVATLIELLQSCRQGQTELRLCCLTERVLSVFQIARLDGVFTISTSLEAASGD